MKLLEKKREEMLCKCAKHIQAECEAWADWKNLSNRERDEAFESYESCALFGFDACLKELEPVLKELVNNYESLLFALQYNIIMFNGDVPGMTREQVFDQSNDIRDRARDALQKYKQLTGGK